MLLWAIYQIHPIEGGGCQCGHLEGGGGSTINVTSTNENKIAFRESVLESDTPSPPSGASKSHYILRFGRFYARYGPDVREGEWGGVCLDDVGRGRGCPKSQDFFDWWMTPYCNLWLLSWPYNLSKYYKH